MDLLILKALLVTGLLLLLRPSEAHSPQGQGLQRNDSCTKYKDNPPNITSWHIHVLAVETSQPSKREAMQLLEDFKEAFKDKLGKPCTGLFYQNRLCFYPPGLGPAGGPFPTSNFAIHINNEDFG